MGTVGGVSDRNMATAYLKQKLVRTRRRPTTSKDVFIPVLSDHTQRQDEEPGLIEMDKHDELSGDNSTYLWTVT